MNELNHIDEYFLSLDDNYRVKFINESFMNFINESFNTKISVGDNWKTVKHFNNNRWRIIFNELHGTNNSHKNIPEVIDDKNYSFDIYGHNDGIVLLGRVTTYEEINRVIENSNNKWKKLNEVLPIGICLIQSNNKVSYINNYFKSLLGIDGVNHDVVNIIQNMMEEPEYDDLYKKITDSIYKKISFEKRIKLSIGNSYKYLLVYGNHTYQNNIDSCILGIVDWTTHENRKKDLEAKNDMLEKYAYITAHDMKSPLSNLMGISDRVIVEIESDNTNNAMVKKMCMMIHDCSHEMSNIIDGSLTYSRINITEKTSFNPIMAIHEARHVISSHIKQFKDKNNTIKITKETGIYPNVYADFELIKRIYQNLFINSIKYSGQNDLVISHGYENVGKKIILYVKDNGVGINTKYKQDAFKLFGRLNRDVEGTGIGLAICEKIVKDHGGELDFTNDENGFKIFFTLPKDEQN